MATVTIDPAENPADPEVLLADKILRELIGELTPKIAAIPPRTKVAMADRKTLTGGDLRKLWGKVKFVITTKAFGPGYGGSFDFASSTSYIRADTVTGWDKHVSGAEFITLHELIHSSAPGEAVRQAMWKKYYKKNKNKPNYLAEYRDTALFSEVEEYCYFGARAIMRALKVPDFAGTFDHGYEYGDLDK